MTMNTDEDRLLTAEEVAVRLTVPVTWVYAAARDGRFPCVRNGRYVRFRPEDVKDWIAAGGQAAVTTGEGNP